jgi:2-oxo-4-hydroxy-4-carboxy--5-ureidoimidazoline (OHCU) decarboxylase
MHLVDEGWERVEHSPHQERATALIEVAKIADHRFEDLVAEANPIHSARTRGLERLDDVGSE